VPAVAELRLLSGWLGKFEYISPTTLQPALLEDGRVLFDMRSARYAVSEQHGRCLATVERKSAI